MKIKVYKNTLGDSSFYSIMGKYFAELKYEKELPYLNNKKNDVWFLAFNNNKLIGFMTINETKNKVKLKHIYEEEKDTHKKIGKYILKYIENNISNKTLELVTHNKLFKNWYLKQGFNVYRETKNYYFMRKDVK